MTRRPWNGWTAADPADIGYAWAGRNDGEFVDRDADGFLVRDLGLADASDGALGVDHLRVADATAVERWRAYDADFDFLYVLAGSATVVTDHGSERLDVGSCAIHPRLRRRRLADVSGDFEAIRVTAPAVVEVASDPSDTSVEGEPVYTHDTPDRYERGNGPRAFFDYRDLGTRDPTEGRIHFHVVRATEPGPGTGWHFHTMAQWFLILNGSAVIRVEDRPRQPLTRLDAMCVGRGDRMRHNVTDFSGNYAVLEMCVPAEYDTVPVAEPAGADAP